MKTRNRINNLVILFSSAFIAITLILTGSVWGADDKKPEEKKKEAEEITAWRIKDFQPYIKAMKDLDKLNAKYADERLTLANDEYSKGIDILEDMENEVLKIREANAKGKHLNERWHWQEVDRNNRILRQITMKKQEAKMKSVSNFTRAIKYIDEIEELNKAYITQNAKYKNFKVRLYQVYVSTQYDLTNFKPCIPILERYIKIDETTKNDVWAYKYLSSCYAYMEKVVQKSKGASEDEMLQYRQKKNEYLLVSVKIQFGIKSPEYKHMKEIVEKNEMKTQMLNDYR